MKKTNTIILLVMLLSIIGSKSFAYDIAVKNADGVTIYYNWINNNTELEVTYERASSEKSYGYESLQTITIPLGITHRGKNYYVTSIGESTFSGCTKLKSVTIPENVTSIGMYAFRNCTSLISVNIPENVTTIGYCAFIDCKSLVSVNIPNNVTSIESKMFYNCSSLVSVNISNNVTSIGEQAFYNCSSLKSVKIPDGVTTIGTEMFFNTNLCSLTIGSGVTFIKNNAFNNKPIKTIWLTNTPPSGYKTAEGTVNYVANTSYTSLSNKKVYSFLSSIFEVDGIIYVPVSPSERTCEAIDCLYDESAENVHINTSVSYMGVTMTVKNINPYTCYKNSYIKKLELVIDGEIGESAFYGCSSIETCILGEGIININSSSFSSCYKLKQIIIPNSVISIGNSAFQNCGSLVDVQIGNHVKQINASAFEYCSSLPQIVIPASVISIDDYTFNRCTKLATILIANRESELSLGSNSNSPLFEDCPLDSVYIGGNITYKTSSNYGYSPFYRNTSLRTIHITDKETEISPNEFYGCTGLKNVRIGDGVTTIGNWAFSGCSSLDYFAFGSNVKTIGKEAFSDCTAMTQLYSSASTPPSCGSQALDDINKWNCTLHVPIGCVASYQETDQWKEFFFVNEIPTKINVADSFNTNNIYEIYDLQGKKRCSLQPGLNIIRENDGTIKKIIVK